MKLIVCKEKVPILCKMYYNYIASFKFVQNIKRIPKIKQCVKHSLLNAVSRNANTHSVMYKTFVNIVSIPKGYKILITLPEIN
jgi:F0F1-type ATP synthase gamma subunit